jgi:hypothetical protein
MMTQEDKVYLPGWCFYCGSRLHKGRSVGRYCSLTCERLAASTRQMADHYQARVRGKDHQPAARKGVA